MANDDYFVLVYRILKYFYACFKEGKAPDKTFYSAEAYKINEKYWSNIIKSLVEEEYVKGIIVANTFSGNVLVFDDVRITEKGIEFLSESPMMKKAKEVIEIASLPKQIIPFI